MWGLPTLPPSHPDHKMLCLGGGQGTPLYPQDCRKNPNGAKEGVTTLPSGLQYKVLSAGEGKTPRPTAGSP